MERTNPFETSDRKCIDLEKLLEASLDLGRNWTIFVVVASFAATYWHQDVALVSWMSREVVAYTGVIFAVLWMFLSILRFMLVARFRAKALLETALSFFVAALLALIGFALIMTVARIADNANAVITCSPYANAPDHKIHNDPALPAPLHAKGGVNQTVNTPIVIRPFNDCDPSIAHRFQWLGRQKCLWSNLKST